MPCMWPRAVASVAVAVETGRAAAGRAGRGSKTSRSLQDHLSPASPVTAVKYFVRVKMK